MQFEWLRIPTIVLLSLPEISGLISRLHQIENISDPHWLDIKMAIDQDRLLARIISDLSDNRRRKLQGLAVEYLGPEWNELGFDTILR